VDESQLEPELGPRKAGESTVDYLLRTKTDELDKTVAEANMAFNRAKRQMEKEMKHRLRQQKP
jgi:hypothetical protein